MVEFYEEAALLPFEESAAGFRGDRQPCCGVLWCCGDRCKGWPELDEVGGGERLPLEVVFGGEFVECAVEFVRCFVALSADAVCALLFPWPEPTPQRLEFRAQPVEFGDDLCW